MIHTFNMHDTLNKSSKDKVSEIEVPVVELPTRPVSYTHLVQRVL